MSSKLAAVIAAVALVSISGSAFAASVIHVTLFDRGASAAMATDLGMTMGGDKSKAVMNVAAAPAFARSGEVTFDVTNSSTDFIHEMLVVKVDDKAKPLPYLATDNKVDEDAAMSLGEVSELDPGKKGSLTLKLDPGTYMLFCNLPGHYMAGMWTLITVK